MSDLSGSSQQQNAQVVMELVLHEAACNGDDRRIEELQIYLKKGKILINQPDAEWGERTPLHCAAERGQYTILYYTILYYTILYYTIPYHTIPHIVHVTVRASQW